MQIAGIFPAECLSYAAECEVDIDSLFSQVGINSDISSLATGTIELSALQELMRALWHVFPVEQLGLIAGGRIPATALGSLGQAFLAAENLQQALDLAMKYWWLVGRGVHFAVTIEEHTCTVTLRTEVQVDTFLSRWMLEAAVGTLYRTLESLLPDSSDAIDIYLAFPEPVSKTGVTLPAGRIRYNCAVTQVCIPRAQLERGFPFHSRFGLQMAVQDCETRFLMSDSKESLSNRVRTILGNTVQGFPALAGAASILGMSPRSLRRRLAVERTNYTKLVQEARLLEALELLRNPKLKISEVGFRLGYSDEANFSRAFKQWTQKTPTEMRLILSL